MIALRPIPVANFRFVTHLIKNAMKTLLSALSLFFSVSLATAQVVEKRFKVFNKGEARGIVQTADGGFVLAGQDFDSALEKRGALVFKVSFEGDTTWKAFYHQEEGSTTAFKSVIEATDGGVIVMGYSIKYNTPDPGNVTSTVVMKFSADGVEQWSRSFANPGEMLWNTAIGSHIASYTDGGVLVSINIGSLTCGGAALIRLDAEGNLIWSRNYHGAGSGRGILVKESGEIYFTGSVAQGGGVYKAHLTQVDPATGAQIFSKLYDFADGDTYGREIIFADERLYLVGGHADQMFLVKLLNDGTYNAEWSKLVGESMGLDVTADIIGADIVLAGIQYGASLRSILVRFDFEGNYIDDYVFSNVDGSVAINGIAPTIENELAVIGTYFHTGTANSDIYFGKSPFPLPAFCSFVTIEVPFEDATVIVTTPTFNEVDSPVERPISLEASPLIRMTLFDYCSLTRVSDYDPLLNAISIYPNPAQSIVQITADVQIDGITIYNSIGKMVKYFTPQDKGYSTTINLSDLPAGMYLVTIETAKGVTNKRLVKE